LADSFFGGLMVLPIPVVKIRENEMTIDDLGITGEGTGRIDGFALFVDGALPAERVWVKALKVSKSYVYAELLEVAEPFADCLGGEICRRIPGIKVIVHNIIAESTNVVLGVQNKVLWGESFITDMIDDLSFRISPLSFFQVNPVQTKVLYEKALEFAGINGAKRVIDLFCGIGTISLFLAQKAKFVYGVEEIPQAINDAETNARLNNVSNVRFICSDAKLALERVPTGDKIDAMVVDPPRKGCDPELLDGIVRLSPERIVYVSCNPATLVRDVKQLTEGGYRLIETQSVDMFPWTGNVETVVLMSRV